jgi:hypothetical protein
VAPYYFSLWAYKKPLEGPLIRVYNDLRKKAPLEVGAMRGEDYGRFSYRLAGRLFS